MTKRDLLARIEALEAQMIILRSQVATLQSYPYYISPLPPRDVYTGSNCTSGPEIRCVQRPGV